MIIINLLTYVLIKIFVNIIFYKRRALYFRLIHIFSFNNPIYTFDGIKVHKSKKIEDDTYRFTVSGLYMGEFQKNLLKIRKNFIFLDIGCNIGYYSLIAGKNKKLYKIFSIEPNPKIKRHLDKNLNYNFPKIKYSTFNLAISNRVGDLNFYINKNDSGSSSLVKTGNAKKIIKVKSANYKLFDKIFRDCPKKKVVVKIDAEGKDLEVLKEIKKSKLFKNTVYIYIECKNKNKNINEIKNNIKNFNLKKKYSILKDLQYKKNVDLEFVKKNYNIF